MKLTLTTAAALACISFGATAAQASTINATVSDDRTIRATNGVATSLFSQNDGFLRTFGPDAYRSSAIEFDLTGLSMGDTVTSAVLRMRDEGTSRDGRIDIYGYAADGVVSLADDLERNTLVGALQITQANGIEDFAIDVTAFLQGLANSAATHAGFLLVSESTLFGVGGSDICSSEAGNGTASFTRANCLGFGPSLTIETSGVAAVPLPASLPLLLAGLGGVGLLRRRKNSAV